MLNRWHSKSRPDFNSRGVHLRYIDPAAARRDAYVAASMAFMLSQERASSDMSPVFPDPLPTPAAKNATQFLYLDSVCQPNGIPRSRSAADLRHRHSIRFVHPAPSNGIAHTAAENVCSPPTPTSTKPTHTERAISECHPAFQRGVLCPTRAQSIRSLQRSPSYNNKTRSGAMLRNKENVPGGTGTDAATFGLPGNKAGGMNEQAAGAARRVPVRRQSFLHNRCSVQTPNVAPVAEPSEQEASAPTSESFPQPRRRLSFSFSSTDDEQALSGPPQIRPSPSLNLHRRHSEAPMRKSLRKSKSVTAQSRPDPVTPSPYTTQPPAQGKDASSSSGSLRRTASKMGKAVRSRLRGLWGHGKSEATLDQMPAQHIEARKSHGSLLAGHKTALDNHEWMSGTNFVRTDSDRDDGDTVIHGGCSSRVDADEDRRQSEIDGSTSRFTSWSSLLPRSSSGTSSHRPMSDFERPKLPVISEDSDRQLPAIEHPVPMASPCSSSVSSPSLAGSGRGDTPRQTITPSALQRLQNLTRDLQDACLGGEEAQPAARGDDPFYDRKGKTALYAFSSDPATPMQRGPAVATLENNNTQQMPSCTASENKQDPMSPYLFFRGTSPYRRALQENMKSFEDTACVTADGNGLSTDSDGNAQRSHVKSSQTGDDDDDDAPLLRPHGLRQWSRVQA